DQLAAAPRGAAAAAVPPRSAEGPRAAAPEASAAAPSTAAGGRSLRPRQPYVVRRHLELWGFTAGCGRCRDIEQGTEVLTTAPHSAGCRARIGAMLRGAAGAGDVGGSFAKAAAEGGRGGGDQDGQQSRASPGDVEALLANAAAAGRRGGGDQDGLPPPSASAASRSSTGRREGGRLRPQRPRRAARDARRPPRREGSCQRGARPGLCGPVQSTRTGRMGSLPKGAVASFATSLPHAASSVLEHGRSSSLQGTLAGAVPRCPALIGQ
ncbi:unnamed protein product, partial [Prorocentrum cordatum]